MNSKIAIPYCLFLLLLSGPLSGQLSEDQKRQALTELIYHSEVFSKIFTGFALYEPESKAMLFEKDANKYFTPASNTKILTLYTTLKVLGDSITALRYVEKGDSLIFWGTGSPLLLHPQLPPDTIVLSFLRDTSCQLFFSAHNFTDQRYGPGWAWDDYHDYYQVEKSPLPLYGNVALFRRSRIQEGFEALPGHFQHHLLFNPALENYRPMVRRHEYDNIFEYNSRALTGMPFDQYVPFRATPSIIAGLLSDTLGQAVGLAELESIPPQAVRALQLPLPDTLLRLLMYDSDNFIAEQLLLACSEKLSGSLSSQEAIRYASKNLFQDIPGELVWRDGSGLSRYNLLTPRILVGVLELLYQELPRERLLNIFPAGGASGTIRELYAGKRKPYVFAKTGTLSNRHCLSGYVLAKSGKLLLFSFMHNNYIGGTGPVKSEMEKVLRFVRDNY